jgi:hypothetical protein
MYRWFNQSKIPTKLIWQPEVISCYQVPRIANKIAERLLSLARKWVSLAKRLTLNVINYKEFYLNRKQNPVSDNFRPYLTTFYIIAQNMNINPIVFCLAKKLYQLRQQFVRKAANGIN